MSSPAASKDIGHRSSGYSYGYSNPTLDALGQNAPFAVVQMDLCYWEIRSPSRYVFLRSISLLLCAI